MSVIIRLQNLAWSANALDIRQFFRGLSIPEGGVHIVGGELGDAFIAFSTDEDARQAMMQDGGKIKEMKIKLLLSSRTEMQKVIETARQQTLNLQNAFMQSAAPVAVTPSVTPLNNNKLAGDAAGGRRDNDVEGSNNSGAAASATSAAGSGTKDRKDRRDRSRSRERSRSRDRDRDRRDRDRGGRDRRGGRRDRSRSRDRDRDRRDRNRRRRDRSRSRDRTRSRDRDAKRGVGVAGGAGVSGGSDRRKDMNNSLDDDNNDVVCVGQFTKDKVGPNKKPGMPENNVWDVPPQNQIQPILMPNLLNAAVAASVIPQESDQRPGPFNLNQGPLLGANQYALNGLGGVGGMLNSQLPSLSSISNSLSSLSGGNNMNNNNRNNRGEPWNNDRHDRHDRMDGNNRFPSQTSPFSQDSPGFNSNGRGGGMNFRLGMKPPNNSFLKQDIEGRRNPHSFQPSSHRPFENGPDRGSMRMDGRGDRDIRDRDNRDRESRDSRDAVRPGNSRFAKEKSSNGYCIEVRNMPLSANYNDVRHAFQGIYIRSDGIKLITDTHGNRVGIAYVKFNSFEAKEQALKGMKYVRGSEVEVLHLDESIFDKTNDSYDSDKLRKDTLSNDTDMIPPPSTCVLVSDLPSFVKEMDIAKMFQDWKINDLFITCKKDMTGAQYFAYVQFARLDDAKLIISKPHKMGGKPVVVLSISEEKFEKAKAEHEQMLNANSGIGGGIGVSLDGAASFDCVIMRNLPFQTIDRDILDFFSDVGLVPHRIHMLLNQSGKPAGECFCEFDSCEEAVRATAKNGLPLGKNIPTIELVNRTKMLDTLGLTDHKLMDHQQQQSGQQHYSQHMQDPRPRFSGMHHPPRFGGGGGGNGGGGGGNGGGGGGNGMGNYGMRGPPMMGMPPRMMMGRHGPPPQSMPSSPSVEGFGKPGCVLALENVPFKADIEEIIEFFGDFNIHRDQIIRRYNDKGMPTGDARVAFATPAEAQKALRELRNCKMRDRVIYLRIA